MSRNRDSHESSRGGEPRTLNRGPGTGGANRTSSARARGSRGRVSGFGRSSVLRPRTEWRVVDRPSQVDEPSDQKHFEEGSNEPAPAPILLEDDIVVGGPVFHPDPMGPPMLSIPVAGQRLNYEMRSVYVWCEIFPTDGHFINPPDPRMPWTVIGLSQAVAEFAGNVCSCDPAAIVNDAGILRCARECPHQLRTRVAKIVFGFGVCNASPQEIVAVMRAFQVRDAVAIIPNFTDAVGRSIWNSGNETRVYQHRRLDSNRVILSREGTIRDFILYDMDWIRRQAVNVDGVFLTIDATVEANKVIYLKFCLLAVALPVELDFPRLGIEASIHDVGHFGPVDMGSLLSDKRPEGMAVPALSVYSHASWLTVWDPTRVVRGMRDFTVYIPKGLIFELAGKMSGRRRDNITMQFLLAHARAMYGRFNIPAELLRFSAFYAAVIAFNMDLHMEHTMIRTHVQSNLARYAVYNDALDFKPLSSRWWIVVPIAVVAAVATTYSGIRLPVPTTTQVNRVVNTVAIGAVALGVQLVFQSKTRIRRPAVSQAAQPLSYALPPAPRVLAHNSMAYDQMVIASGLIEEVVIRRFHSPIAARIGLIATELAAHYRAGTLLRYLPTILMHTTCHVLPLPWAVAIHTTWNAIACYLDYARAGSFVSSLMQLAKERLNLPAAGLTVSTTPFWLPGVLPSREIMSLLQARLARGASFGIKDMMALFHERKTTRVVPTGVHSHVIPQAAENCAHTALSVVVERAAAPVTYPRDDSPMLRTFSKWVIDNADELLGVCSINAESFALWNSVYPGYTREIHEQALARTFVDMKPRKYLAHKVFPKIELLLKGGQLVPQPFRPRAITGNQEEVNVITGPWIKAFTRHLKSWWNGRRQRGFSVLYGPGQTSVQVGEWIMHYAEMVLLPSDCAKYDGSISKALLILKALIYFIFSAPDAVVNYFLLDLNKTAYVVYDLIMRVQGTVGSGAQDTSVGNSMLRGLMELFVIKRVSPGTFVAVVVGGDDNLSAIAKFTFELFRRYKELFTELGIEIESPGPIQGPFAVSQVDFFSARAFPCERFDGTKWVPSAVMLPKLGRVLAKFGYYCNPPPGVAPVSLYYSDAQSRRRDYAACPIYADLVKCALRVGNSEMKRQGVRPVSLRRSKEYIERKHRNYLMSDELLRPCVATYVHLLAVYGLGAIEISDYIRALDKVERLPTFIVREWMHHVMIVDGVEKGITYDEVPTFQSSVIAYPDYDDFIAETQFSAELFPHDFPLPLIH